MLIELHLPLYIYFSPLIYSVYIFLLLFYFAFLYVLDESHVNSIKLDF